MKQKLTKSVVEAFAPVGKEVVVWDTELPGFGIRVKPAGVRSYVVQYRDRQTGESRRKTIGQHGPLLTFHKARDHARIILSVPVHSSETPSFAYAAIGIRPI